MKEKSTNGEKQRLVVPSKYICKKDNIDDILEKTGGMGRYQIFMQVLAFLIMVTSAHQALDLYFLADDPAWKCSNYTDFSQIAGGSEFCRKKPDKIVTKESEDFHKRCSLTSNEWQYDVPDPETYSIVTEFNLVCSKSNLLSLAHSSFFIGSTASSLFIGYLADTYGRKYVFILMAVLSFATNIATYYVTRTWQFILARMILGALNNGGRSTMYVQVFEFVLPRHRAITSNLVQLSYAVSIYYLALVAYLVRGWRTTLLYTTLPCAISILAFRFYRSPRWLILKERYREAEEVFQKLGQFNKSPICVQFQAPDNESEEQKTGANKTYTIIECFKHKQTLVIFFTILCIQYVSGVIYYTMYLEFNNIGGSLYLVIALAASADIPAMFLASYFPEKYGRKKSFIASLLIIGLCVIPIVLTPQDYPKVVLVRTTAAIAVKVFFSFSADVMVLWTLEIFPTVIRTQGFVMTIMGTSIGAATAPFVVEYMRTWAYVAPFVVIVALCLIGIVLSLLLPETLGLPAREKFEDFFKTVPVGVADHSIA